MTQKVNSEYPKVLVLSHNCFSKTGSNGRTLANFFIDWPKESLAQFYINEEMPDSDVCDNYFRVTDIEALKAFYKGAKVGKKINKEEKLEKKLGGSLNLLYKNHKKRSSFKYIARNFIWDSNRWKNKEYANWVNDFNPDLILLQLGDYSFMIRIALEIAEKRNIPIIVYCSEDYYFKDVKSFSPIYHFYRKEYKKLIRRLYSYSSHVIYNSEMLKNTYQKEFVHQSTVIMTSTNNTPLKMKSKNSPLKISYLGNLGVGRHEPLMEIGKTLNNLDSSLHLDIYGNVPNNELEKVLSVCPGIRLKGFVSYEEVIRVMNSSDLLVHAENFSEFYKWDLKHAFSTKIADSLASGTSFFVYAPENMAFSRYLIESETASVVTEKENLKISLENLIKDENIRNQYSTRASSIVKIHHNIEKNALRFKRILSSVAKKVNVI